AATAALIGGAVLVEQTTIDGLLYNDAVSTGRAWTDYVRTHVDDLDAITAGSPPSAKRQVFFDQVQQVGQVFLYTVYDSTGVLRLVSDQLPQGQSDQQSLPAHNAKAAQAIAQDQPTVEVHTGQPPTRPAFYAEAYVPVIENGKVRAVVEAYVDQTAKRA